MRSREEKKKCKGQETTIGKIIYGFLLFLPLLAIGVTCSYAIFNKNAYQSYTKEQTLEQYKITNNQSITKNQEYTIKHMSETGYTPIFYSPQANEICLRYGLPNTYNYIGFRFLTGTGNQNSFCYGYNDLSTSWVAENHSSGINFINRNLPLTFVITDFNDNNNNTQFRLTNIDIYWDNYSSTTKLDNIFYYSIDKVQESPLFNWAENSFIYTTTATTCTQLHITTPFIPLLMSYWLIISVIYFLYDIALMLVWTIHKKIHELQESI